MARRLIVIAATDLLLKPFDLARKELDRTATIRANHMMVATPVVLMFVAGDAIMKGDFAGQATLGQQLECAVNSRVTDPGVFFLDQPMQLVCREMLARFQKRSQDRVALRRLLQANTFQMLVQDALSLAHHFGRDRRLVIDAFLEHAGCGARANLGYHPQS